MVDWSILVNEFRSLGINDYQCRNAVIPLDKVFGLNESYHNDGLNPYGVADMSLFSRGVSIEFYTGNIFNSTHVCSEGRFRECGGKNKRLLTEKEEQGVYDYCMSLINERKESIERGKYWMEHFNDFVDNCLSVAKKYVSEHSKKYDVKLCVGNSVADKRVAPALVITYKSDGSQRGYVKILQNKYGDISLDACCMCHTTYDVKNPDNIEKIIGSACAWCF